VTLQIISLLKRLIIEYPRGMLTKSKYYWSIQTLQKFRTKQRKLAMLAAFAISFNAAPCSASPVTVTPPVDLNSAVNPSAGKRVVTFTYLKAAPGRLAQLERYIRANWFVMDERAVRDGLFVSYGWLDTGSEDGPWNAVVIVTYNDDKGFSKIQSSWSKIKAAHTEVRPDGLGISELGTVIESRELFERLIGGP
jgi:hypothetical protein